MGQSRRLDGLDKSVREAETRMLAIQSMAARQQEVSDNLAKLAEYERERQAREVVIEERERYPHLGYRTTGSAVGYHAAASRHSPTLVKDT